MSNHKTFSLPQENELCFLFSNHCGCEFGSQIREINQDQPLRVDSKGHSILSHTCIAQTAEAVEYTNCITAKEYDSSNECPGYDTKQSDVEALGNAEYPLTAIAPGSSLAQSSGT